jgi:hypothetical protein
MTDNSIPLGTIRRPPTKTNTPGWRGTSIPASSSMPWCRAHEKTTGFDSGSGKVSAFRWAASDGRSFCADLSRRRIGNGRKVVGAPLALVEMEAAQAAELFNAGGRKRGTLPDCLIAATALMAERRSPPPTAEASGGSSARDSSWSLIDQSTAMYCVHGEHGDGGAHADCDEASSHV